MTTTLPTFSSAQWTVTELIDSIRNELMTDQRGTRLTMWSYAVTVPGWREIRTTVRAWLQARTGRTVSVVAGTDHALSDPAAFERMIADGVVLRLATSYRGTFHPKVVHLSGPAGSLVWVGSNNLTREGLRINIEMAALLTMRTTPSSFQRWEQVVLDASEPATQPLIDSYRQERDRYLAPTEQPRRRSDSHSQTAGDSVVRGRRGTFVWSRRVEPLGGPLEPAAVHPQRPTAGHATHGGRQLVMEIMPKETGADGKQVQVPKQAAVNFFGLRPRIGSSRRITIVYPDELQQLTMTIFGNNTVRLILSDLDYRDRPCVVVFTALGGNRFSVEIVQRAAFPTRYRQLLALCAHQTRPGSRRWSIIPP